MTLINKKHKFFLAIFLAMILVTMVLGTSCKTEQKERTAEDIYAYLRAEMVEHQIVARKITDARVIDAMLEVPRHKFIPEENRNQAYNDTPVYIGEGQTISQPYVVAVMTQKLELLATDRVLEIGTGSGYQAAILAEIVEQVYTVEIIPVLHERAKIPLLYYDNVEMSNHDGYYGWEEYAPFDKIIVTAAPDHIPPPLIAQLKNGGIMVIPVGPPGWNQVLWKVLKEGDEVRTVKISDVVFVPLTGGERQ
jgi:protein-L-isoaspartate(D-aspartate) O-methyltransferase